MEQHIITPKEDSIAHRVRVFVLGDEAQDKDEKRLVRKLGKNESSANSIYSIR